MRRLAVLVLLCAAPVACSSDDETADPGCQVWSDFLAESGGDASDAEAASVARSVAEETRNDRVRSFATALAARLEDGTDLGNAMSGLGEACDL